MNENKNKPPLKPIVLVSSNVEREEAKENSTTALLHELVSLNLEIVTLDNERANLSNKLETATILQKPLIEKRDRLMKDLRKALGEKF